MNTISEYSEKKISLKKGETSPLIMSIEKKINDIVSVQNFSIDSPTIHDIPEMAEFFEKNLTKYVEEFDSLKNLHQYLATHTEKKLMKKIEDPKQFFSIIRALHDGEKSEIACILEWHTLEYYKGSYEIRWTLVDEKYQSMWLGGFANYDFIMYCRERGVRSILTMVAMENKSSRAIKKRFGFVPIDDYYLQGFEKIL